jgi:hypothetical protein
MAHTLPIEEFTFNRSRPDGRAVYCKTCAAAKQRKWKKEHPDKVREWKRNYRLKEKEHASG